MLISTSNTTFSHQGQREQDMEGEMRGMYDSIIKNIDFSTIKSISSNKNALLFY